MEKTHDNILRSEIKQKLLSQTDDEFLLNEIISVMKNRSMYVSSIKFHILRKYDMIKYLSEKESRKLSSNISRVLRENSNLFKVIKDLPPCLYQYKPKRREIKGIRDIKLKIR